MLVFAACTAIVASQLGVFRHPYVSDISNPYCVPEALRLLNGEMDVLKASTMLPLNDAARNDYIFTICRQGLLEIF